MVDRDMTDWDPVAPPEVPASAYTRDYYTSCCAGFEEWSRSGGRQVAGIYPGMLDLAHLRPGEVVIDLGTGRGELLAVAIELGAARATGIEYAPDAVELAEQTIDVHGVGDQARVVLADARRVPLPDGEADLVTMLDVIEHLSPAEVDAALAEALRLLRPGGRIFVHTAPNRNIYEVTYRWQRRLRPWARRRWPADPRNDAERLMHVNEQTPRSVAEALARAGFVGVEVSLGDWIYTDFVPGRRAARLYHLLARFGPTKRFAAANLFGRATKAA